MPKFNTQEINTENEAGRATYHPSVMQTVQSTAFGVDPRMGYTVSGFTAERMPDQAFGEVQRRLASQGAQGALRAAKEPLLPVLRSNSEVVADERSLAPERLDALNRNTHLGEMIGAWAGRQAEEELAHGFNPQRVDRAWEIWDEQKRGRESEFVNLSDPDLEDPVHEEAWNHVPQEMPNYIPRKFKNDGFRCLTG